MIHVILLAGGSGSRIRTDIAKQHIVINNHQIIEYTLTAFSNCEKVDHIVVVSNPEYIDEVKKLKTKFSKLDLVVSGGNIRMKSVYNGINAIKDIANDSDKVIISDAARPCITRREINDIVNLLDYYSAVTTAISSNETILKTVEGEINQIIQREGILRQTSPEGYKFSVLKWLYLNCSEEIITSYRNIGIDQLFASGMQIGIVESNSLNFKITTQEDLMLFESVLCRGFENIINT